MTDANRVLKLIPITKVWRNKVAQYGDRWRFVKFGSEYLSNGVRTDWLMETENPVHAGGYPYNKWGRYGVDFTTEETV